ncbi:hypothetical protein PRIPAC_75265 [Pristionchus pacificus]|uniref:Uncharacterized protein n=1 Tax=Pristionchus pacificus TaxID=54126 RepID=A0A2A6CAN5_PRIPA|nr:hypothetical protein PRIPAC_75265 [Pristionchus pacificus]|eukprot:PDM75166.1 hypothetical protein PRIPAC_40547 [Pristionchus pacificus]
MVRLFILLSLVAVAAAAEFKQGNDCTELKCDDRPGTVCQMVAFDCTNAPCPPSAYCVPKGSIPTPATQRNSVVECSALVKFFKLSIYSADDAECKHRPTCVKYPKCGVNEEYRECNGEGEQSVETCKNEYPYSPGCGTGGCVCKVGFIRHEGKCIKRDQCPDPECPVNEMWSKCPGNCQQPTCRSILSKEKEKCEKGCGWAQCVCKPGYVKNDDNACVRKETCPKTFDCASPYEVKKQCSSMCEPTCWNREPVCVKKCGPPKCQCKEGYVREGEFCLSEQQCPHVDPVPQPDAQFTILN